MTQPDSDTILAAIDTRRDERRRFLRYAGGGAIAAGGLSLLSACGGDDSGSGTGTPTPTPTATPTSNQVDIDVLNFALNLEYLEAQFYNWAAFGAGIPTASTTGVGTLGKVTGGALVPFSDPLVAQYAREIALDERAHVNFLRTALGGAAVAMPDINIAGTSSGAFTAAATAAGVPLVNGAFNPYADDISFLLGAFIFEDVGVTAYKGAVTLITNKTYLEAAAGIHAAEAYHAGLIRSVLYRKGVAMPTILTQVQQLSDARDSLDGPSDLDQGIGTVTAANIVPADSDGIAFSRSAGQVLNIAFLNKAAVTAGGFFPTGITGNIRQSAASG